jgi:hypothetical protein
MIEFGIYMMAVVALSAVTQIHIHIRDMEDVDGEI